MLIDDIMVAGVIRASNLFFLAVEATSFGGIPLGSSGNREVRSILPPARQQEKSSLGTIHDRRAGDPHLLQHRGLCLVTLYIPFVH